MGQGRQESQGSIPEERGCPDVPTLTMMIPKVTQWTPLTWAHIYPQVEDLTTPLSYLPIHEIAENLTNSDTGNNETEETPDKLCRGIL